MKLWGGRFSQDTAELMKQFNDSFSFDRRLYAVDIRGSQAYAQALRQTGLLTEEETGQIQSGLAAIKAEFDSGQFEEQPGDEDIHTAVERRLHELIGEAAGKLHTGRSRNDQVALDLRLYLIEEYKRISRLVHELQEQIVEKAEAHLEVVMPGFTHLQPAQPVLFGHWLMSYFWMLERDKARLADWMERTAVSPLGSGALAGTPFDIDRHSLAESLGLLEISMNSLDAVSDRDFAAEFLFALSMIAVHLSRLAEDLVLFSSPAFGFLRIGEEYTTGSSLMPQKRNPDSMELTRGKTGRIISALFNLLVTLKGLPSSYNKDLQEDKPALFDAIDNLTLMLPVASGVVSSMEIFPDKMAVMLDESLLATDLADALVRQGMPFRQAHHRVGELIRCAEDQDIPLSQLSPETIEVIAPQLVPGYRQFFEFGQALERKCATGGTAPQAVRAQLHAAKELLA